MVLDLFLAVRQVCGSGKGERGVDPCYWDETLGLLIFNCLGKRLGCIFKNFVVGGIFLFF
jgi:hypothetical protein